MSPRLPIVVRKRGPFDWEATQTVTPGAWRVAYGWFRWSALRNFHRLHGGLKR